MNIDMKELTDLVRQTKTLLNDTQAATHVTVKGRDDYVTEVDFKVQEFLKEELAKRYPSVQFMGEEKDNRNIRFEQSVWILDPVDGTTNLIHGYHCSAVSLGLYENGVGVLGIIYQPFHDEMFSARKGEGAFLNGIPIRVSTVKTLKDSLISIGTNPYHKEYAAANFRRFQNVFLKCQDIRRSGSAAMDLAYVACGRQEAFFEQHLSPWDFAAGAVILREAGGVLATFSGGPVSITGPSEIVACNNSELMDQLLKEL